MKQILSLLLFPLSLFAENLWVVQRDTIKYGKGGAYELQLRETQGPDSIIAHDPLGHQYFIITPTDNVSDYLSKQSKITPEKSREKRVLDRFVVERDRSLQDLIFDNGFSTDFSQTPYFYYVVLDVVPGKDKRIEAYLRTKGAAIAQKYLMRVYKTRFGRSLPKYLITISGSDPEALKKIIVVPSHMNENVRSSTNGIAHLKDAGRSQDKAKKTAWYRQ